MSGKMACKNERIDENKDDDRTEEDQIYIISLDIHDILPSKKSFGPHHQYCKVKHKNAEILIGRCYKESPK